MNIEKYTRVKGREKETEYIKYCTSCMMSRATSQQQIVLCHCRYYRICVLIFEADNNINNQA